MNTILGRVFLVCEEVRESTTDLTTFKKLISKTRKVFKQHDFDIDIKTKRDKSLIADQWYIMAYYDSENDFNLETPIEVIVYHNLVGDEKFGFRQVSLFLIEIFDAVVHEFRHQYQSMRRDHNEYSVPIDSPYKEYLASADELDAYAFTIAIELLRNIPAERAVRNLSRISIMSKMRTGPNYASPTLRAYIEHFGLDPTTKRLAKKVFLHLQTIDKQLIFL